MHQGQRAAGVDAEKRTKMKQKQNKNERVFDLQQSV